MIIDGEFPIVIVSITNNIMNMQYRIFDVHLYKIPNNLDKAHQYMFCIYVKIDFVVYFHWINKFDGRKVLINIEIGFISKLI